ncbi:MaoC/PaaZ C-terminal domain-containing protein [Falsiroseomonas stagni]|uniref:MaoC like domain-containing protein n=1 Tax=Falsiroseomonas stagni DSM 19981 TaxID=1123062 RepID=A0A1I4BP76_9PROT|nr:MaoC/PaaZ C-terminal domain-containing protein [Falsiroseomonas stagni]SFK70634.1 MaoC like domain-containing protein [Falsiroseomonas stagni DSM 19981]
MKLGIEPGAEERFSKTVTERDLLLTAEITGDHDPLHVDEAYAARTAYGQRIAHGALVLGLLSSTASRIAQRAIAAGAEGVPVSIGYDRVRFLAPVFVGDTLTAHYIVESTDSTRGRSEAACEVVKADGTRCLVARHILKWVAESR